MTLLFCEEYGIKRNDPNAVGAANGSKHKRTSGGSEMSVKRQYGDSRQEINIKHSEQWKSIAVLARQLVTDLAEKRAANE